MIPTFFFMWKYNIYFLFQVSLHNTIWCLGACEGQNILVRLVTTMKDIHPIFKMVITLVMSIKLLLKNELRRKMS